jgi:hypothetical protein
VWVSWFIILKSIISTWIQHCSKGLITRTLK